MTLSRRDFLKIGGASCIVAGTGAALAGCAPAGGADGPLAETGDAALVGYEPVNFREEVDVLIIGSGYAGLAAAMAPALAARASPSLRSRARSAAIPPPLAASCSPTAPSCSRPPATR